MSYTFGPTSAAKLATCDDRLQRVARRALGYGVMDFAITEGLRTLEKQQEEFRAGRSKIDGVSKQSKHQQVPSQAMDLLPWPAKLHGVDVWQDKFRFTLMAGLILAAAAEEGVTLRWGGDWSGDGSNADQSFHDLPHFELKDDGNG
jgi:peptidoglycan L-alanyl-D-glutamate endopeptidase CwlK